MGAELGFSTEHSLAAMVSIPGTRLGTAPEAEQHLGNAPGFGEQDGTTRRGDVTSTRILSTSRRALEARCSQQCWSDLQPSLQDGPCSLVRRLRFPLVFAALFKSALSADAVATRCLVLGGLDVLEPGGDLRGRLPLFDFQLHLWEGEGGSVLIAPQPLGNKIYGARKQGRRWGLSFPWHRKLSAELKRHSPGLLRFVRPFVAVGTDEFMAAGGQNCTAGVLPVPAPRLGPQHTPQCARVLLLSGANPHT